MMKVAVFTICLLLASGLALAQPGSTSASQFSIQAAIDASPGRVVYLPPGDYPISAKLVITRSGSGLSGPGRIIMSNPSEPIIEVVKADNVQLCDITLTRAEGQMEAKASAISSQGARNLLIENVQIFDNHAQEGTILINECRHARILNCLIQNYTRIGIDDRTSSTLYGYAFNCIDGTGIQARYSAGCLIQGNRIIELNLLPTQQIKDQYGLGKFTNKSKVKGTGISQETWDANYVNNWHQGSAIQITSPENTDYIQLLGNYIENAAQGVDIHADHVILAQNIVNNAFIGMKAMHGSRNVQIIGNQFSRNDLWAIGLMPGSSSHEAGKPTRLNVKPEESPANIDGGTIIANNIVSDFGYGSANWMWGNENAPFRFDATALVTSPPLRDVIVQGNLLYDPGRDQILVEGKPQLAAPRYKYAVLIGAGGGTEINLPPSGLHFANNLFHPGTAGIANAELKP